MKTMRNVQQRMLKRWIELGDKERGDVPGWVLITLMTAGLVTALWAVAEPQLKSLFSNAISRVGGE